VTVKVITDSAASLPPALAAEAGITVVPLRLSFSGQDVRDCDVDVAEVLRRAAGAVQTSGPPPGEYASAINDGDEDGALVITIADAMSSTFDAARVGARLASRPSRVLDSGTAGGAEGLVALAAAEAAAAGMTLEEVEAVAAGVASRVRLVAAVKGLDDLVRSGRVPQAAAWAGKLLGLNPLFEFRHGRVRKLAPASGREQALNAIVRRWRRDRHPDAALHVAVIHALDPEGAEKVLERVRSEVTPKSEFVGEFSPVMVVHTGPLVGLSWWYEPPA
jgi:DegV family protein with EDD domain